MTFSNLTRKKVFKNLTLIIIYVIFFEFSGLVNFAIAAKVNRNTLNLNKKVALEELKNMSSPGPRSALGKKILAGEIHQPNAFSEYAYALESAQKQVDLLEGKFSRNEKADIERRILAAKMSSIRDLYKQINQNFDLEIKKPFGDAKLKMTDEIEKSVNRLKDEQANFKKKSKSFLEQFEKAKPEKFDGEQMVSLREMMNDMNTFSVKQYTPGESPFPERKEREARMPRIDSDMKPAYILQKVLNKIKSSKVGKKNLKSKVAASSLKASSPTSTSTNTQSTLIASAQQTVMSTPADLAETTDVVITPEMRALVEELNRSPARIFEWVKNNIEVEFYHGSLKGSAATFIEKAGNDMDTASLLIALYRAAGIPSRYVQGTFDIPMDMAKSLTGISYAPNVSRLLANAGIPTWNTSSGEIRIEHTWVEALVDYAPYSGAVQGQGDSWVPLSPWYKFYETDPRLDIVSMSGFNRDAFLADFMTRVQTEDPVDRYRLFFESYFAANKPGFNWQDGLTKRILKPETFRTLPSTENFKVVAYLGEFAAIPAADRHTVTIKVPEASLMYMANICDIVGKKVTLSYPPADNATRDLIDAKGGIENVNPTSVRLRPSLKIEGAVVATGSVTQAGYPQNLQTIFYVPGFGNDAWPYTLVTGGYYAIGIDPHFSSNSFMADRISKYMSKAEGAKETTRNIDDITGEAMYIGVMRYFSEMYEAEKTIAGINKIYNVKETCGAVIGKPLRVITGWFDAPIGLEAAGYTMDAKRDYNTPVSITGSRDREKDFMYLRGYNASFNEHDVFEDFFHLQAVSTVKMLQIAQERGMPIYDIDRNNINTIMPLLTHDVSTKTCIQNAVYAGKIVRVHKDPIRVGNYVGGGHIDRNPITGAASYLLTGGLAGAWTVVQGVISELAFMSGFTNNCTTCSNPVNIANGNKLESETDFVIPAVGQPITIKRYYNGNANWISPFGYGWSFTYDEQLKEDILKGIITYRRSDGAQFIYKKNTDGTYANPFGIDAVLAKNSTSFELREKSGYRRIFDLAGKLIQLIDRNSNALTFSYAASNLTTITDPAGRDFSFAYIDNKITSITAPGNNVWSYAYDGNNLISVTNNAGQTTSYAYENNRIIAKAEPEGKVITFDYYSNGKVHAEIMPNGGEMSFSYNAPLKMTTVTGGCCMYSVFFYDEKGQTTGSMDALGNEELYEYDSQSHNIKIIHKNGSITKNIYDTNGNLITTTDPLNFTTSYTYDTVYNQIETITDPEGNVSTNTYDANGNLISILDPENTLIENEYYPNGLLKNIKKSGIIKTSFAYFPDGNISTVKAADNTTSIFTYNELGRITSKTDANGNTTSYELDKAGNIITTTDAEGHQTHFTYNQQNLRTSMTDANGNTTIYEYNEWGKLVRVVDPMGYEKTHTYTSMYELETETDKNGNTISYEYDSLRRISKKIYPDRSYENYSYDVNGNIIAITDKTGTISRSYDQANRLIRSVDVYGQETKYTYTARGARKSITDPLGDLTAYDYYKNAKPKSITDPAGKQTSFIYQDGTLAKVIYPNNTQTVYTFNVNDRPIDIVNTTKDGTVLSSFHYEYDASGNRISMADNEGNHTYEYDKLYQVTRVQYPDGSFNEYTYDAASNRNALTTAQGVTNYTYDKNNRMLTGGDEVFTYDNNGNQIAKQEGDVKTSYVYDYKNQLRQINYADGRVNEFTYNAGGQRITKKDNFGTVLYLYDGANLLMEANVQGVINASYVNDPVRLGALSKKNARDEYTYFLKDALGSTAQLTDANGSVIANYKYDIFGAIRNAIQIDSRGVKQAFTGKELDDESGLMYFGARYYNPTVGRFITADSFTWGPDDNRANSETQLSRIISYVGSINPIRLNLFQFVCNNPINKIDVNGHHDQDPEELIILFISLLVALVGILAVVLEIEALTIAVLFATLMLVANDFMSNWLFGEPIERFFVALGAIFLLLALFFWVVPTIAFSIQILVAVLATLVAGYLYYDKLWCEKT